MYSAPGPTPSGPGDYTRARVAVSREWDAAVDDLIHGLGRLIRTIESLGGINVVVGSILRRQLRRMLLVEQYADFAERERVEGLG